MQETFFKSKLLDSSNNVLFTNSITNEGTLVLSESGTLSVGSYTLEMTGLINETISSSGNPINGSNNVSNFTLNPVVPVPEPSTYVACVGVFCFGVYQWWQRRRSLAT